MIADSAARWLDANGGQADPWFLTVALVNPHDVMWFPMDQPDYQAAHPDELAASAGEPVDYVSAGPVEPTPTKPGRPGTGLDYIRLAAERSPHPFFVTGGVSPTTLPAIAAAGATRFVVVRALTQAADPAAVAADLRRLIAAWPS